jgi:hypothetical protein
MPGSRENGAVFSSATSPAECNVFSSKTSFISWLAWTTFMEAASRSSADLSIAAKRSSPAILATGTSRADPMLFLFPADVDGPASDGSSPPSSSELGVWYESALLGVLLCDASSASAAGGVAATGLVGLIASV